MFNVTLSLDPASRTPMYEQLYRYFVSEIHAGRLSEGEKLPSKRALCAHLGVSCSTVETAYGLLAAEGYILSRAKSGYYVSDFVVFQEPLRAQSEPVPSPRVPDTGRAPDEVRADAGFDFSTASVDTSLFPYASWAKLNREVVYASPELLQRGERQGDEALRNALAVFLAEYRGVRCAPEQIVVGAGMEVLTALLLRLLPRGAVFGVEDPGYAAIRHTIAGQERQLRFLPLDEQGLSAAALEDSDVSVAYITPAHQFPMGVTMPAGRRSQLLRWAGQREERYLIEDDYDSEFRYAFRPLPALQSMGGGGRVIYIGTFSRSLAPSIRLAYMVLPPALLERYRTMPGLGQCTVSRYEQAVMARFLSEGFYARYLRRVGNLYRKRRALLLPALEGIGGVTVSGSGGGLHFLLTDPRYSEAELLQRALEQGLALRGLSGYCRACTARPSTLVVGYGGLRDDMIPEAVRRLAMAWGR